MQDAVRQLVAVAPMLTDSLDEVPLRAATDLLDQLVHPLSEDDGWTAPRRHLSATMVGVTLTKAKEAARGRD